MAVVITPLAIGREAWRVLHTVHYASTSGTPIDLSGTVRISLLGAVFAFLAGLVALRWLSNWLENGRWYLFGVYCLWASAMVFWLHTQGY
jgi:undecaprenyl-diphosphatase